MIRPRAGPAARRPPAPAASPRLTPPPEPAIAAIETTESGAGRQLPVPAAPRAAAARTQGIFALAWPSLVENLLLLVMNMASLMMVGRLGPAAMAGVGIANQMAMLLQVIFMGLAVGNTALVARAVGAGEHAAARAVARQSLLLGTSLALLMVALCLPTAPRILSLFGADAEVVTNGTVFLRAIVLTLPLLAAGLVANGTLRGAGDTRTPMWATGAANLANVAVAFPLIFGVGPVPALGLTGAALGLAAGRTLACLLSLLALARRRHGPLAGALRAPGGWRPDAAVLRRLLGIGGPAALEGGSIQAGMLLFSTMVIHLGTAAFAAQQVVFSAASLSMMPGQAFSVAATTLVGQYLGAGDRRSAARAGWQSTAAAAGWMTLAGLGFILLPEPFLRLYTTDPAVIAAGIAGIRVVGLGQPFQAVAFVLGGALRGAGDTRTTLLVGGASMWGVRLTCSYVFGIVLGWGLPGIWIGWSADWCVRGVAFLLAFARGRWQRTGAA